MLVRSSHKHKVFKIKYHLVFCIKYRKDLFLEEKYVSNVKQVCKDIENRFHILFETIGFDEDHVHCSPFGLAIFIKNETFKYTIIIVII